MTSGGSIVMSPPLPVSPLTEVEISLLTRYRKSRRCKVMLPPLAVEVSASVEIAAPPFISKRAAEMVIDPASPLPVDFAVICGPVSGNTISEATVMLTSPPVPEPWVALEITPLLAIIKFPALTLTIPALPVLPALVCEKMPVRPTALFSPAPSIVS